MRERQRSRMNKSRTWIWVKIVVKNIFSFCMYTQCSVTVKLRNSSCFMVSSTWEDSSDGNERGKERWWHCEELLVVFLVTNRWSGTKWLSWSRLISEINTLKKKLAILLSALCRWWLIQSESVSILSLYVLVHAHMHTAFFELGGRCRRKGRNESRVEWNQIG